MSINIYKKFLVGLSVSPLMKWISHSNTLSQLSETQPHLYSLI